MYVKDLNYFLSLAQRRSFREAAEACGVSQPTLSVQLARLESELKTLLIERRGRGSRLTPAGERAVPHAARVLQEVLALRSACDDRGDQLQGPFHLGVIATAGPYILPHILPRIRRALPLMQPYLREDLTADLLRRLLRGDLDAAIVSLPLDEPALASMNLFSEAFQAIVPIHHPLAKRKQIGPEELGSASMLLLEHGHCLRGQTTDYCHFPSRPAYDQATSIESLKQMVAARLGCALVPALATQGRYARMAGIKVIPLKPPVPHRVLALAWRKHTPRAQSCRALAETLQAEMSKQSSATKA
jgi:LysR family transcriptional regulator, hydrogen peroxide-inducible genes activator